MLIGGAKLDGERHICWNFVASSKERIERAKADWKEGRFPKVPGDEVEFIPLAGQLQLRAVAARHVAAHELFGLAGQQVLFAHLAHAGTEPEHVVVAFARALAGHPHAAASDLRQSSKSPAGTETAACARLDRVRVRAIAVGGDLAVASVSTRE